MAVVAVTGWRCTVSTIARRVAGLGLLALLVIPMLLVTGCGGDDVVAPPRDFEAWVAEEVNPAQAGENAQTVLVLFSDGFFRLNGYDGLQERLVGTWTEADGLYTLTITERLDRVPEAYGVGVQLFGRRTGDEMTIWGVDRTEDQAVGFVPIEEAVPFVGGFDGWRDNVDPCGTVRGEIAADGTVACEAYNEQIEHMVAGTGTCTVGGVLSLHFPYPGGGGMDVEAQLTRDGGDWHLGAGTWRDDRGGEGTVTLIDQSRTTPPPPPM